MVELALVEGARVSQPQECDSRIADPSPHRLQHLKRMSPVPWLGSTVELILKAWVGVSQGHERARELPLPPADGNIGWPSQSHAGEIALMCR